MYKGAKVSARLLICEDCGGGNCGGHFQPRSLGKTPDRTSHGASGAGRGRGIVFSRRNVPFGLGAVEPLCGLPVPFLLLLQRFQENASLGPAPDDSEDSLLGHVAGAPRALCSACCCGDNLACSLHLDCRPVPKKTAESQVF